MFKGKRYDFLQIPRYQKLIYGTLGLISIIISAYLYFNSINYSGRILFLKRNFMIVASIILVLQVLMNNLLFHRSVLVIESVFFGWYTYTILWRIFLLG